MPEKNENDLSRYGHFKAIFARREESQTDQSHIDDSRSEITLVPE